ncbi:hypothetical protein I4U23_026714 [Adineta vaga]|nr:hypothetical protein I4U23_026714 [Adineta vaga]
MIEQIMRCMCRYIFRFLTADSLFFSVHIYCVLSNVKIDRLVRCFYASALLIKREDEQFLFHPFIDDNDEKVVGPNHLQAYCTFLLVFFFVSMRPFFCIQS